MVPTPIRDSIAAGLGRLILAGLVAGGISSLAPTVPARAESGRAAWQPEITERLVKLPASYLQKTIDRDFAASPLAQAMHDAEGRIGLKVQTLQDLRAAIDKAEGEVKVELRHQFLAEKQAYVELLKQHQDLRRQQLDTRARIYDRLMKKLALETSAQTPEQAKLADQQVDARNRLERTVDAIDSKLFATTAAPDSRYGREYARNLSAMNALIAAIKAHPMTRRDEAEQGPMTKPEYLRHLVADNEAERSLLTQEGDILGHMAKLVALDATALSEDLAPDATADADTPRATDVAAAVELFLP